MTRDQISLLAIIALLVLGVVGVAAALTVDSLGLNLTPGFGVLQMTALLVGLTGLTVAGLLWLRRQRPVDAPRSLQADIGVRLAATGLVLAYACGFSDLIGIGTHVAPAFERPFVGPLQWGGIGLGLLIIVAGMYFYYTSRGVRPYSSMEFLINGQNDETSPEGSQDPRPQRRATAAIGPQDDST